MKVLLFMCIFLASSFADDEWKPVSEEEHNKVRKQCLTEHSVPAEVVAKAIKLEFQDDNEPLRCAFKCVGEKLKLFDSTTGLNVDRLYDQALSEGSAVTSKDDMKSCISQKAKDEDDCTWAYRDFKCMIEQKFVVPKNIKV